MTYHFSCVGLLFANKMAEALVGSDCKPVEISTLTHAKTAMLQDEKQLRLLQKFSTKLQHAMVKPLLVCGQQTMEKHS